ncbi:yippee-domain-containing protein [Aureobasidium pullulans]|uniref:Yippee-domain-containing protein n=1 Tax=Aureobasidium pullulans TaxID=5580 RepID=A0A4S9C8R3_AURPU|nr:yippee-domain-containing protein [Aureobasidium pullulans]THW96503.1 yippee-domain-containing protein [Aureobasidium pullulans]THX02007.1 yippee-domain-containing protein [Aureobasidium pullulans]THX41499.1 yippee-domain-containing protein [Aureobasidium pullulans]THY03400.1 yippee-domain-containing protein [Aureobasidium pullulans]
MSPSIFPSFLVPSLPFRRRKSSTDSNISTSSTGSNDSSNHDTFLDGNKSHLQCSRCLADLALSSQIISKGFTGRHGRAYLVSATESWVQATSSSSKKDTHPNLPNTFTHKPVPRQLVTGAHTVSDISCAQCGSVLGWKYVAAEEESQQYKVGKFILETRRTCRNSCWEGQSDAVVEAGGIPERNKSGGLDDVEFDSQDEDECEELFMGIWNPQIASRRRAKKAFPKQSS